MKLISTVRGMKQASARARSQGDSVGLVPTMGCLHDGHLSLVGMARRKDDVVVVSIFVNPTQFGPKEDLATYPRDLSGDLEKCRSAGVDVVFAPSAEDMYRDKTGTFVDVEGVTGGLCGTTRPGHFRGVATVVTKLFNIVRPDRAYFGRKDYQQTVVVRKMVRDLDMNPRVVVGPTVREPDGLAMSSRNRYLGREERKAAAGVYASLLSARRLWKSGETRAKALTDEVRKRLAGDGLIELEYVSLVDPDDLSELNVATGKAVLAVAVRIGRTRLIDNVSL